MAKYEADKMILNTVCQVCHAVPAKVPLTALAIAPGILFIPDILYCAKCGAQLTVQVREYTKEELEKKKQEAEKCADQSADAVILDEFAGDPDVKTES